MFSLKSVCSIDIFSLKGVYSIDIICILKSVDSIGIFSLSSVCSNDKSSLSSVYSVTCLAEPKSSVCVHVKEICMSIVYEESQNRVFMSSIHLLACLADLEFIY